PELVHRSGIFHRSILALGRCRIGRAPLFSRSCKCHHSSLFAVRRGFTALVVASFGSHFPQRLAHLLGASIAASSSLFVAFSFHSSQCRTFGLARRPSRTPFGHDLHYGPD